MQIELRRLTGKVLERFDWTPPLTMSTAELTALCKERLMSYYHRDEAAFWPLKAHYGCAPEEVRMIDDNGNIVARYDVCDVIRNLDLAMVGTNPTI